MKKVHSELSQLKDQIVETNGIDENTEPLTDLIKDIDLVLGNPGEFPFAEPAEFIEKLENALLSFEAGHEKLLKQVRVVINSLNEVGI